MIIVWYENHKIWRIVLLSIYCVLPLGALISYGSLWCFHTYTLYRRITTYQYLNRNRKSFTSDNSSNKLSEEYKSAIEKRNKLEREQWENQHSNNSKSASNLNIPLEENTVDTINTTTITQSAGDITINIKDHSESNNAIKNEVEPPKSNQTSPEVVIEMNEMKTESKIESPESKEQHQDEEFHSDSNSPVKNSIVDNKINIETDDIELNNKPIDKDLKKQEINTSKEEQKE